MAEAKRDDTYVPPSFVANLAPNYLGNPQVVNDLLEQFCGEVLAVFKRRSEDALSFAEAKAALRELGVKYARIFGGHDPAYAVIEGYNRVTLPYRARSVLGEFWQRERGNYDDDALRVVFCWLTWALGDAITQEDTALADLGMIDRMRILRELMLGTTRRR